MSKRKTVGIIQARMNSSRLPGKMMMDLCGYPVIRWVIERCKRSLFLDELVLATTVNTEDDCLSASAVALGIQAYRGDVDDVLLRVIKAANQVEADIVVRVCADNPLVTPEEIDRVIRFFSENNPDYAFNHIPKMGNNYPDGLGAEVMSAETLGKIDKMAVEKRHREHVTLFMWEHPALFDIRTISCPAPYNQPLMKLDIDTGGDLATMKRICKNLSFYSTAIDIFQQWKGYRES